MANKVQYFMKLETWLSSIKDEGFWLASGKLLVH